jgi:hypothetical protein
VSLDLAKDGEWKPERRLTQDVFAALVGQWRRRPTRTVVHDCQLLCQATLGTAEHRMTSIDLSTTSTTSTTDRRPSLMGPPTCHRLRVLHRHRDHFRMPVGGSGAR